MQAIQSKIIDEGIYNESTCYLTVSPELISFPASDHMCVISVGRQSADQPLVFSVNAQGCNLFSVGTFYVTLWTRFDLDQISRADGLLSDTTIGMLGKLNCILANLQLFYPTAPNGNWLFIEPMRMLDISEPKKFNHDWYSLTTSWEVRWMFNQSQPPTNT